MITLREIQLAQDVVEELRARGADEKATAIEHIVATATPTLTAKTTAEPRELFTTGQAARAFSVSIQTIKNWAAAGHIQTVRLGGRVMIHRDSLLDYLDRLRKSRPVGAEPRPTSAAETGRREFVLAGLPREKVERVRALSEKIEASQPLTEAEESELIRLQEEFARVSWERLQRWVAISHENVPS
jgi:excisionase family DNA binding protein